MITQAQLKYFKSLSLPKNRNQHNVYVVEGEKMACEWLKNKHTEIVSILAVKEWIDSNETLIKLHSNAAIFVVSEKELERISQLKTANKVFLEVKKASLTSSFDIAENEWILALERVQDPGNMGTIIRIADWFGIKTIICSDCADIYNPKVLQATMGGLLRVEIKNVTHLPTYLSSQKSPIYVTDLNGDDLANQQNNLPPGVIVMGNESKGVSPEIISVANYRLKIPGNGGAESLNVAVATGIICFALVK